MTLIEQRDKIRIIILIVSNLMCLSESSEVMDEIFFILWWTRASGLSYLRHRGVKTFTENKCQYQNCYLTDIFSDSLNTTDFSALLFDSQALSENPHLATPSVRNEMQKYILVSTESAVRYPISSVYNNLFNWTLTYKLDSDIVFANIAVLDIGGNLIGPKTDMHWIPIKKMEEPSQDLRTILRNKRGSVVWLVWNCSQIESHYQYVFLLRRELGKYNFTVDILGDCDESPIAVEPCGNNLFDCIEAVRTKYRFMLTFETTMAKDYVTRQLLIPLTNYAVPVVYGGANYTRFMPDGIYLDALELSPEELARKIKILMIEDTSYYDMFRWHNHYSYHRPREIPEANAMCTLCKFLNDDERRMERKTYTNIVTWFNERKDWIMQPTQKNLKNSI